MTIKLQILIVLISLALVGQAQDFIKIDNLEDLKSYSKKNNVRIKLKPGKLPD